MTQEEFNRKLENAHQKLLSLKNWKWDTGFNSQNMEDNLQIRLGKLAHHLEDLSSEVKGLACVKITNVG